MLIGFVGGAVTLWFKVMNARCKADEKKLKDKSDESGGEESGDFSDPSIDEPTPKPRGKR